jgi:ubiquinone/menaquinone biosynthesis C-methylase UbiE
MKLVPIKEEIKWWGNGGQESTIKINLPSKHNFAHNLIRSKLYDVLVSIGCNSNSSILEVGCGSGEDAIYIQKASKNIIGVDIAPVALKKFTTNGFQGCLGDVGKLPFHDNSFDYVVCSGLLHHLIGQGDLEEYLREFIRVTRERGVVIALEPNSFNHSGFLMNIFNTIKPGITGLVPHERALSPLYLIKIFNHVGLNEAKCISASYVWNRFPLFISKIISQHDDKIRFRKPFNMFGWFIIVYARKKTTRKIII